MIDWAEIIESNRAKLHKEIYRAIRAAISDGFDFGVWGYPSNCVLVTKTGRVYTGLMPNDLQGSAPFKEVTQGDTTVVFNNPFGSPKGLLKDLESLRDHSFVWNNIENKEQMILLKYRTIKIIETIDIDAIIDNEIASMQKHNGRRDILNFGKTNALKHYKSMKHA